MLALVLATVGLYGFSPGVRGQPAWGATFFLQSFLAEIATVSLLLGSWNFHLDIYLYVMYLDIKVIKANECSSLLVFQELSQIDASNTETEFDVALCYRKIAEACARTGEVARALDNCRQALIVFERLSTRSPTNAKIRNDLALTYYDLGMVQSKVESETSQSEDCQGEARAWYQKSLDIYLDMKNKGTLSSADTGKPEELAQEIAMCDAALRVSK